jgi:hypothetical protein
VHVSCWRASCTAAQKGLGLLESALASDCYILQAKLFLASMERANLSPATLFVVSQGAPQLLVAVRRLDAVNLLRLLTVLSESGPR